MSTMSESAILHHANRKWFDSLINAHLRGEINFWTKPKRIKLEEGQLFFLKEKGQIFGCGEISRVEEISIREAWLRYGIRNGVNGIEGFIQTIKDRKLPYTELNEDTVLLCIILANAFRFNPINFSEIGLNHNVRFFMTMNTEQVKYLEKEIFAGSFDTNNAEREVKFKEMVVQSRLFQQYFRDEILNTYSHECLICGCDVDETLEAAHILEVRDRPEFGADTSNGLCMCRNHHAMFDRRLLLISAEGEVSIESNHKGTSKFITKEFDLFNGIRLEDLSNKTKSYLALRSSQRHIK